MTSSKSNSLSKALPFKIIIMGVRSSTYEQSVYNKGYEGISLKPINHDRYTKRSQDVSYYRFIAWESYMAIKRSISTKIDANGTCYHRQPLHWRERTRNQICLIALTHHLFLDTCIQCSTAQFPYLKNGNHKSKLCNIYKSGVNQWANGRNYCLY